LRYNINMIKDARKIKKLKIFNIYKRAFAEWKGNFNNYTKLTLIVAIPAALLGALQTNGILSDYGQILAVAWAFAFISIIFYTDRRNELKNTKLSTVYTAASGRFLQFLAVSLILALFALPFILGLVGLFFSLPILNLPPLIFLPVSIAGLVLSGYLLARFGAAQIIVVASGATTSEALKQSKKITKKNLWKIFFGTLFLILLYLVVLTAIQFFLNLNKSVAQNQYISNIIYVIEACVLVPTFFVYQTEIYKELNG